jgi:hypothetical protein
MTAAGAECALSRNTANVRDYAKYLVIFFIIPFYLQSVLIYKKERKNFTMDKYCWQWLTRDRLRPLVMEGAPQTGRKSLSWLDTELTVSRNVTLTEKVEVRAGVEAD